MVFSEAGEFKRRIGFENITNFPNGIDVSGIFTKIVIKRTEVRPIHDIRMS